MKPSKLRSRQAASAAALALVATSLSAGAASASNSAAATARVAPTWLKLSSGAGVSTVTQPRVARWGTKLLVTWQQRTPADLSAINTRLIGSDAKAAGPVSNVVTWYGTTSDPQPLILGNRPTVVFGGLRSGDITDPYDGRMFFAQADDASSWSLGPGPLTQNTSAYGDYGFGVADDGTGQPIVAGAYSSTDHVTVDGIDPANPTADQDTGSTGAAIDANLARDSSTGVAWALWYSGVQDAAQQGIRAAQVKPAIGPVLPPAPLSNIPVDGSRHSTEPGQDVAVTARIGGGVWAAYPSGWPIPTKVVLWHVGTSTTLAMNTGGGVKYVGVSAAPGGRLWVWWIADQTLYAARTNPSVTKFGVVRAVRAPATPGQAPTSTSGDGRLGPLDAVINVIGKDKDSSGNPEAEILSTRIMEGLKVAVSPGTISAAKGGRLVVHVTDAGVPVAGVAVRVGSVVKHTNAKGAISFLVAKHSAKGSHVVSASAVGWWPGSTSFRVG